MSSSHAAPGGSSIGPEQIRVLLIEDNPGDAHLVRAFLERAESEFAAAEEAATLAGAIAALRASAFDLVLLDLGLPDARDLDALEAIYSETPDIPIVVITIKGAEALGRRAVEKGAQDYLVKPQISPETLFRSLRYALERHRRREAEEALLRAQKMNAVGQLAGGVAHEFNNLLLAIRASAELALVELPPDHAARRDLTEIERATDRAADLTRQLLAFSRKQPLQLEILDLNGVILGMDELLLPAVGEHTEVVTRLEPELGRVRADRDSMQQVIMTLALNARDAMPEGGTLTISTRNIPGQGAADDLPHGMVELSVADTGTGMDQETLGRIFEPFFTTRPQGSGTGLGLSAVHGIVQQSGGEIAVKSARGEGTTFAIRLPRVEAEPETPPALDSSGSHSGTILLVDDEDVIRNVAARILRRGGYEVMEAGSAADAIALASGLENPIHLLLTDVVMPGASGPELADELVASRPDMKVVFMSGYAREHLPMDSPAAERIILVEKPFSGADLLRAVGRALAG